MKKFLLQSLQQQLSSEQLIWLEAMCGDIEAGGGSNTVCSAYTAASRRLGKRALEAGECGGMRIGHWGADEAGRAVMLLSLADRPRDEYARIVRDCYELGDSREQQSWLRGLILLPHCEMFLDTAIDACRTNIIPLFEAIACENPYPAKYFPELNFNQMVLKCLFNRIAVSRIVGLESRLNEQLSRMADNYARELNAAGREVSEDIKRIAS